MENTVIERKLEKTGRELGGEKSRFYLQLSYMLCNNLFVYWIDKSSNKILLFVVMLPVLKDMKCPFLHNFCLRLH